MSNLVKISLKDGSICCSDMCIVTPEGLLCATCKKRVGTLSDTTRRFLAEIQKQFNEYDLPDGVRVEVVNPAYQPRLYLSPRKWDDKWVFGAHPVPNKNSKLSAAETQAKVIAVGKTYREIAGAVAFLSERYGKHNVHIILKQRQEAPAIKRLDDEGNETHETQSQRNIGDDTMRASDMFPSKYLKSSDVKDKPITATISHLTQELVGQGKDAEKKPILHFKDAKAMVLNKTNALALEAVFGDSDNWGEKKIRIHCVETTYGGRAIDGIRVKPLAAAKPAVDPELNDEISL
jgi:hypothetical protein